MDCAIIIITVLLAIISAIINIIIYKKDFESSEKILVNVIVLLFSFLVLLIYSFNTVDPMSIIRGNFNMRITYKNNIPIDTSIVYSAKKGPYRIIKIEEYENQIIEKTQE